MRNGAGCRFKQEIYIRRGKQFMRKIIQMLVIACMVVFGTQVALANADKETLVEGADITFNQAHCRRCTSLSGSCQCARQ